MACAADGGGAAAAAGGGGGGDEFAVPASPCDGHGGVSPSDGPQDVPSQGNSEYGEAGGYGGGGGVYGGGAASPRCGGDGGSGDSDGEQLAEDPSGTQEERLQKAFFAVRITTDRLVCQELESPSQGAIVDVPPGFTAALTAVTVSAACMWATDLNAFSAHRGAKTINVKDVLLLARRNPALEEHMASVVSGQ